MIIYKLSDNIISSLGFSSQENYRAVKNQESGLHLQENTFGLPEPFVASLIDDDKLNEAFFALPSSDKMRYTKLEKAAILAVYGAFADTGLHPSDSSILFVFATTKGNIELLDKSEDYESERIYLWRSAQVISRFFDNGNEPLIISNACISGVAAQITAARSLTAGRCKYVVVTGMDMLSRFIVSGFQSLKALSSCRCRPFDKHRTGLNLGEAAASILYATVDSQEKLPQHAIVYENGALCNDANHISGPSRTGEGLFSAVSKTMYGIDKEDISFVNAHGTATPYNDDMEAIAIERSNLNTTPVNSLKAYFGHTLGAAGVLETIISAHALEEGLVLPSLGFEELGVAAPLRVNTVLRQSDKNRFLKLISGFGGGNAALILRKHNT
ncbi:MAG: beta-ketoacyl synthase [Bacteroidales bacterium]|jgi:3-oxoacyl-[acyl-carrier-protein] synthase-1|nr:beta-ketoacyl synthase [Bacteroidales bacterium]